MVRTALWSRSAARLAVLQHRSISTPAQRAHFDIFGGQAKVFAIVFILLVAISHVDECTARSMYVGVQRFQRRPFQGVP